MINQCYSEEVHWIPNLCKVPFGNNGIKPSLRNCCDFFRSYSENSAMECIALKAVFLLHLLVLQKPHRQSKSKDLVLAA